MEKLTHTPGPWKFKDEIFANRRYVRIYGSDLVNVTDLNTYPSIPVEANARLIAAAPDLLAALEEMAAVFGWQSPNANPAVDTAIAAARAAIAKAKGK